jgi:hypothetical protein
MALSDTIRERFPGVRILPLVEDVGGTRLVVAVVADETIDRGALADALVRGGADEGVTIHPAVYGEQEWNALERSGPDGRETPVSWQDAAAGDDALRAEPTRRGRSLRDAVRSYRVALDVMTASQPVPHHLTLWLCARLVRRGLEVLFATEGLTYSADAAGIAAFDQRFASRPPFRARHATLHMRLVGSARQAEHAYWVTGRDDGPRPPAEAELEEAADFLRGLERHVAAPSSEAARTEMRRRRRLALAVAGPLLVLLAFGHHLATRPEAALQDPWGLTKPGAIVGQYFAGENFDQKVLERNDDQIAFTFGDGPPDPRLGADHFTVRWNGYLYFEQRGSWHLCGKADDGQRIYFNHRLLVDDWTHDEPRMACETVRVMRGWYPLQVEFVESVGHAAVSLYRGPPRRSLQVVPGWVLCCPKQPDAPSP